MLATLIAYLNRHTSTELTQSEIDLIKAVFVRKKFKKRQFILRVGEVCSKAVFILKGAMRRYSIDENGNEHIMQLMIENWWAIDRESYAKEIPSKYFIDACEETDALVITKNELANLIIQIPALQQWMIKLEENHYIASEKRLHGAISMTVEQRYLDFAKAYPEFLERFPLHIIASYLGVSRETLSRIRNHSSKTNA
jgi:CRP-like cAMP-binding protein